MVHEDGRLGADGVLRVAVELVTDHRFDGDALARSYLDLARRGHLAGTRVEADVRHGARRAWRSQGPVPAASELAAMVSRLPGMAEIARGAVRRDRQAERDALPGLRRAWADVHNARRRR